MRRGLAFFLLCVLSVAMLVVAPACVGGDPDPDGSGPDKEDGSGGGLDGTTGADNAVPPNDSGAPEVDAGPPLAKGEAKWLVHVGDTGSDSVSSNISYDSKGNVIVCGMIEGASVDVGCAEKLVAQERDGFVAKYDAAGNCLWARRIGGSSLEVANACVAGPDDDVYVTGDTYGSSWTVGTSSTSYPATGAGGNSIDMFVVRFAGNDGSTKWARAFGASGVADRGNALAVSANGMRVALAGSVSKNLSVDVKLDDAVMPAPAGALISTAFVAELDSSNGVVQWIRGVVPNMNPPGDGGPNRTGNSLFRSVAYDSKGRIVAAGTIHSSAQGLGGGVWFRDYPNPGQINLDFDNDAEIIVAKYDPALTTKFVWAEDVRMSVNQYNRSDAYGLAIDGNDRAYVGLSYYNGVSNSVQFNSGPGMPGKSGVGILVVKPDGVVEEAHGWGVTGNYLTWLRGFARDPWGQFVLVGATQGSIDFGKGATPNAAPDTATFDAFVAKISADYNALWSHQFGGIGNDQSVGAAFSPTTGSVVIGGGFEDAVTFPGVKMLTSRGGGDGFVLGFSP